MSKLYNFLGGVRFALILIAAVAVFVIAGTLIESYTQSHRYASNLTYGNPFFALLLWGFFINILFSATRRWPFQVRHLPFLITHLGLLMILAGALTKNYFGVQGNMGVMEGSGSHEIFETDSYAIQLESKNSAAKRYPLNRSLWGGFSQKIVDGEEGLYVALADYTPHSSERHYSWVKAGRASLAGLPSTHLFEITDVKELKDFPSNQVLLKNDGGTWHFYAIKAQDALQIVSALLGKHGRVHFSERTSGRLLADEPLNEVMREQIGFVDSHGILFNARISPLMSLLSTEDIHSPSLEIALERESVPLKMSIPLDGSSALLNLNLTTPYLGTLPIAVDLVCEPTLMVIEDDNDDTFLAAFDAQGCLWSERFIQGKIPVMYAYDNGYAGYSLRAEPTFATMSGSRQFKENAIIHYIKEQMRHALEADKSLSPPLELLKNTCQQQGVDFADTCLDYLTFWDQQNSWLFQTGAALPDSMSKVFDHLNWDTVTLHDKKTLLWASHLFKRIENDLKSGKDVMELLQEYEWPMLSALESEELDPIENNLDHSTHVLTQLTRQMDALADIMPPPSNVVIFDKGTPSQKAHLFSAYLRVFGIHLHTITPVLSSEEMQALLKASNENKDSEHLPLVLETDLIPSHRKLLPEKKLEDNLPALTLKAYKNGIFQAISLSYSRLGTDLKWPMLNGEYLIRFQPNFTEIPYRVRLRSARQINYANSSQPFSFESDIIITDRRTGHSIEKTISMNNVHETWDGYRFYLANITPPTENAVKQVQLVVNHDPAKYWLTYPGAIIMSSGIVLLFWMRPYRKK